MKIAVTAKEKTLDDQVDPRFGRCPYFLVVDSETLNAESIENPNVALGGGAGIQSAQLMAEHDVKVVLTGNCGPNAHQTLSAADIEVVVGISGTVREAVEQFKSGTLATTQGPNVASHFGMAANAGVSAPESSAKTPKAQTGPSVTGGMAMGRGMGGGGGGRGMGMGGGGGMGGGMGRGGGRGGRRTASAGMAPAGVVQPRLVAAVSVDECTGCGLCMDVCPTEAITIDSVALIDASKCTGCGQCVTECPQDALMLKKG